MTKLEQAARQALGALEVATTPMAKDRQEVLRAITTLREALSGVQALSAAPAEADMFWDAEDGERFGHDIDDIISDFGPGDRVKIDCAKRMPSIEVLVIEDGDDFTYQVISPTPPAEQQAKLGAVYAELPKRRRQFLCTKCGSRECKVGTINEQHPPCECGYLGFAEDLDFNADEMRDFADRTHALRMQAAPKAAPQQESTASNESAYQRGYMDGMAKGRRDAETAPQQEVQEPHGWLYEWTHSSATGKPDSTYTAFTTDEAHARKHDNCRAIYTAPQPAPAELERLRERIARMGLDVDRAMRGHVNEQSPLGTQRLAAIAALVKPKPAPRQASAHP
jgi:ribosome modulation factor